MLFNEPKLLKYDQVCTCQHLVVGISVLFNEPKLLKSHSVGIRRVADDHFSALQRAEIAEIVAHTFVSPTIRNFSALQRAEIAEIDLGRQ